MGALAGPVRRRGQGRDGPFAARPRWWAVADRAAAAPRVRAAEVRSRAGDGAATALAERLGVRRRCPFADLEALRAAHGVSISRFAPLAGIPERTYWRRLARHRVVTHSLPLSTYSALGTLRQDPGRAARISSRSQNLRKWGVGKNAVTTVNTASKLTPWQRVKTDPRGGCGSVVLGSPRSDRGRSRDQQPACAVE